MNRKNKKPVRKTCINTDTLMRQAAKARKERDYKEAARLYRQAAKLGCAEAFFQLGELCYGFMLGGQYNKAAYYYARAGRMGHAEAAYSRGVLHMNGRCGLEKDWKKAVQWWL